MKRIFLSIAILGMAASAAMADVPLTVTHYADGSLQEEITAQALEQGITDVTTVTHLTVKCEEGAVITKSDVCGANTTTTAEQQKFIRSTAFFKNKLVKADFSQAVFKDNSLTSDYYDNDDGILSGCLSLEEVVLPEGLEIVSGGSFKNCAKLKTVYIPNSVKSIGVNAFRDCPQFTITELPESLVTIGDCAFSATNDGTKQANVKIGKLPENLRRIEDGAFNNTNVYFDELPSTVTYIGTKAFRTTDVSFSHFPDGFFEVENYHLGNAAFVNCPKITEFTIPAGMSAIPNQTFYVDKLVTTTRNFYCYVKVPPTAAFDDNGYTGAFGNASSFSNVNFYVLHGCEGAYESKLPYSVMNIKTFELEQTKGTEDVFDFVAMRDHEGYANLDVEVNVIGEENDEFKYDGYYTIELTPKPGSFITRVYYAGEPEEEQEPEEEPEDQPMSVRARAGEADLYNANGDYVSKTVRLENVRVSNDTPKLQAEVAYSSIVTGIESVSAESEGMDYVYNVAGTCVAKGHNIDIESLPSGVYIVKNGTSVRKIRR